jgi:hypothetical protein
MDKFISGYKEQINACYKDLEEVTQGLKECTNEDNE